MPQGNDENWLAGAGGGRLPAWQASKGEGWEKKGEGKKEGGVMPDRQARERGGGGQD